MNSSTHVAPVIYLPVRRARTAPTARVRRTPRTLIISATLLAGAGEIHRHIGVDDSMSIDELHTVIDTCFGLRGENPPWAMYLNGRRLAVDTCVHQVLDGYGRGEGFPAGAKVQDTTDIDERKVGDGLASDLYASGPILDYEWGLWHIDVEVIDDIVRDHGTPRALCIGGTGALRDEEFDPSLINATLTGDKVIEETLGMVDAHVADVIRRSGMYDFIALLQALDIARPGGSIAVVPLPVEREPKARDAFVAMLLSLACMSDDYLTDTVAVTVMESLGWGELDPAEIRLLCADSLAQLHRIGAYGVGRKSAVDRIEIYRELLRRRG